jgi:hypothetical protein
VAKKTQWKKESGILRKKVGISEQFAGWTSQSPPPKLIGVQPLPRHLDKINVAYGARLMTFPNSATMAEVIDNFWTDLSPSLIRKPYGPPGVIATNSQYYSFEKDAVLDARDAMSLLGLPRLLDTSGLSESQLKDLAGEGFSCQIATAISSLFYYQPYGPWWGQHAKAIPPPAHQK